MAIVSTILPCHPHHNDKHHRNGKSAGTDIDNNASYRLEDDSTVSTSTTMTEDSHSTKSNFQKSLRFFDHGTPPPNDHGGTDHVPAPVKRRQFARKQPERRRVDRVDSVKLTRKTLFVKNMNSSSSLNGSGADLDWGVSEEDDEPEAATSAASTLAAMRASARGRVSSGRTGRVTGAASARPPMRRMSSMKNSRHRNPKRDRTVRRSVSYHEDSLESVKEIDKVQELIENADDELWYNAKEIEASKYEIDDVVREFEDKSKENKSTAEDDSNNAMSINLNHEADDGHSMRGLERKTEQGSWMCFQWRNQMLDAVLDNQSSGDGEKVAELCREATQAAVTLAMKRAAQDWLAVKHYLSDVILPEPTDE